MVEELPGFEADLAVLGESLVDQLLVGVALQLLGLLGTQVQRGTLRLDVGFGLVGFSPVKRLFRLFHGEVALVDAFRARAVL